MAECHGGKLFVDMLEREGVRHIFMLSGESLLPIIDACIDSPISIIHTRHEESAGYMADAYARVTGSLGVVGVTQGPGSTNIFTALMTANLDGSPMLCFAGRLNQGMMHRLAGQELDSATASLPYVKWAATVSDGARIPDLTASAIRHSMTGIPGATFLAFERDTLHQRFDEESTPLPAGYRTAGLSVRTGSADSTAVEEAARLLREAKRPLVIAGSGAAWSAAGEALAAFAEGTGCPVLLSSQGRGCLDESHPLAFGESHIPTNPISRLALAEADVIVFAGERVDDRVEFAASDAVNPDAKIIQIWPKAEDIGINRSIEVGLVSDTRAGLEDLLAAYGGNGTKNGVRDEWVARLRTEKDAELAAFDAILANPPSPIHPLVLVHEVKRFLEDAGKPYSVAAGASDVESWARWLFQPSRMGQFIGCGYTGTLGSGFPYAMGMQLARPDDNVVCLQGDLDFSYRAMDIDTCVRYDLPVVSIIANDSTMGYIKREQEALYGPNRSYVTDLEFRNFEGVCEALGGHGELVRESSDIRPALERSFASGKPAVINAVIERIPSPGLNWFYRDIDPRDGPLGSG